MVMVRMSVGVGLGGKPFFDVGNLFIRIVKAAAEEPIRCSLAFSGIEDGRRRIEGPQPCQYALALRAIREVSLAPNDTIGAGNLFQRLGMGVERRLPMHRIDDRDDS